MSNYTGDPRHIEKEYLLLNTDNLHSLYKNRSVWIPTDTFCSHHSAPKGETENWNVYMFPFGVFKVLKVKRRL